MAWQIDYSTAARKQLRKLDTAISARIIHFLETRVAPSPRSVGKPLHGHLSSYWSYRMGNYRIICELDDGILRVLVVTVGHRRDVYKP
ncbi:type II toxin-antitoxin system RelE family toxin [Pseudoduganella aquatica]|uniref:Type II toxin-antitoxin system mRNA interferase toxin, RelE/StbE family n=1 Tax=Pseudoduganella aquatica TaxID=2660641 RepID=A0A7X4HE26_9BURK|nr:type II toxin-antitoxin system RelE/ParE family toxin [Pseudoduganella aquatica]MYN09053.1 type II toxin-antitoxin system mRNA interferase toxin, RelE/StbE family [Pseudoduganella aquatica]